MDMEENWVVEGAGSCPIARGGAGWMRVRRGEGRWHKLRRPRGMK